MNRRCAVPDGLLAVGGDLTPVRLLNAYRHGIFPWYSEGEPILWWSPDPRVVFPTDGVRLSSRFRRSLRKSTWVVRADTAFAAVIDACACIPREGQGGTWITREMQEAYIEMHRLGHAHSVEVFDGERLVGGVYGVAIGRMFFGESMFSAESGGSKVALAGLAHRLLEWGWPLIDAQVENPHLMSLGARYMHRADFVAVVERLTSDDVAPGPWTERFGELQASALAGAYYGVLEALATRALRRVQSGSVDTLTKSARTKPWDGAVMLYQPLPEGPGLPPLPGCVRTKRSAVTIVSSLSRPRLFDVSSGAMLTLTPVPSAQTRIWAGRTVAWYVPAAACRTRRPQLPSVFCRRSSWQAAALWVALLGNTAMPLSGESGRAVEYAGLGLGTAGVEVRHGDTANRLHRSLSRGIEG